MSKKKIFYRQCTLRRRSTSGHGWVILVTWLPERYAEVGRWLRLNNKQQWENHWVVDVVSDTKKLEEHLLAHERDFMNQRGASDV